ncbi:MAG: LacI family DNA-binding transcriptional regulator [Pseudomonadota bacterium]
MVRPTIHDVARTARVSLATVDRVLNKRGGVAEKSVKKVLEAIEVTGYVRDLTAANLSRGREYRFTFLVPDSQTGFMGLMRTALETQRAALRDHRVKLRVVAVPAFDVAAQAAALASLSHRSTDGVAVVATEAPEVQAEMARLSSDGVPVVALVADLPRAKRDAYVGPDNVVAGRTAAAFMGRFVGARRGGILMIAGSLAARDHMERVMGFRMVMAERFPQLNLLPAVQGFDTPETVKALTLAALREGPLAGIYAVGAGRSGLIDALRDSFDRPVTIAHDLTTSARAALLSGELDLVIDQNPAAEVQAAISLMRDLTDQRPINPNSGSVPLSIFVRENV